MSQDSSHTQKDFTGERVVIPKHVREQVLVLSELLGPELGPWQP